MTTALDADGDRPTTTGERLTSLDVLRGFALLGILVMNIQYFAMPDAAYINPPAYGDLTNGNLWVWTASHLLTDEKMFGLFSMLFGAGILLMTSRAERRGAKAWALHFRRMAWLMLFGLVHAHLLWAGDILWTYGVCGLAAVLFRHRSPRTLVASALCFFAAGAALKLAFGFFLASAPPELYAIYVQENWDPSPEMIHEEIEALRGGWLQQAPFRSITALYLETIGLLMDSGWKALGNMLLGMALFKWGVLTAVRPRAVYWRMTVVGFGYGLPIVAFGMARNFAAAWEARYSFAFGWQYNYWGAIIVDMGWVGAIMLLCTSAGFARLKTALAALGRTAFSNYILQTLICTTIFYGHGFGLFGSLSRVQQTLVVVAVWVVQLAVTPLWLRHFRYGPLEWLWRSLTYRQRMPFAIAQ